MVPAHAASGMETSVIFGLDPTWVALSIMVISFALIMTERINRAIVAMLGASMMIFFGILNQHMAVQGVDFNTIALLTGMMVVVGVAKHSGVFQFVAIWAAQKVRGNPRKLLTVLAIITAVFSALLDNVTTVMLMVPVTLLIAEQLKLKAYPFLFTQIFASNIGGMATLIGDPPNILIGSAVNLSFMDFVYNVGPASFVIMIVTTIFFDVLWGRKMKTSENAVSHLMEYVAIDAIKDFRLLWQSLFSILVILVGFVFGHPMGIEPGTTALAGAALLLLLYTYKLDPEEQSHKVHQSFGDVEWVTIFFFIGLFVIVYGVETTGFLTLVSHELMALTEGNMMLTGMAIIWASAIISALVDNIPFVATMIPLIESMGPSVAEITGLPPREALMPLWWSLSLGACLGGNGSLIGASANLMVAGIAERAGQRISFLGFLKLAFPLMICTVAMASVYAWLVFFMQ